MRITNGVPRFQGQKFHYPRVSPGDQPLTKSRRNSGLEIGSNLVPRARVTLVQWNGNEELWDKAFQIAVSLVENLSMRSRAGGQISFPDPALPLWALETRLFLTQTGLGTNNKMAKKMRVSVFFFWTISSPEFLRLFVSGWSPGETLR